MIGCILIVDDSAISRKVTRKCLEFAGFAQARFLEAADGAQALDALERERVDLLVTDLNMPVMDGFELLRAIAETAALAKLTRIVASSAASAGLEEDLRRLGVHAFLPKPLTPTGIAKALGGLPREATP